VIDVASADICHNATAQSGTEPTRCHSLMSMAACSSSSDGGLGASAGENIADYDDLDAILVDIENGALAAEDTSARTGVATMDGAIGLSDLGEDGDLTLVGDMTIAANFDTDIATGSADGFTVFNEDSGNVDSDVGGTLTMEGGTISGSDFDATMNGTLTENGDRFDLALTLDGGFYDNGGDLVVGGDVNGTITDADGDVETSTGGFIATE